MPHHHQPVSPCCQATEAPLVCCFSLEPLLLPSWHCSAPTTSMALFLSAGGCCLVSSCSTPCGLSQAPFAAIYSLRCCLPRPAAATRCHMATYYCSAGLAASSTLMWFCLVTGHLPECVVPACHMWLTQSPPYCMDSFLFCHAHAILHPALQLHVNSYIFSMYLATLPDVLRTHPAMLPDVFSLHPIMLH